MEEKERLRFVLGIMAQDLPSGKVHFRVMTENHGIPDEYLIMLLRNWLKVSEQIYHDKFRQDQVI